LGNLLGAELRLADAYVAVSEVEEVVGVHLAVVVEVGQQVIVADI